MSTEIRPFAEEYANGVVALAQAEGWPTFSDAERVTRLLTAPGVVGLVAVDNDKVVGAAQLLTDGHQAYLAILVVAKDTRGQGIGKRLIEAGFAASKAERMDLLSTPESEDFYRRFPHREVTGLRLFRARPPEAGDSEPGPR